jgi:hypothetical protein
MHTLTHIQNEHKICRLEIRAHNGKTIACGSANQILYHPKMRPLTQIAQWPLIRVNTIAKIRIPAHASKKPSSFHPLKETNHTHKYPINETKTKSQTKQTRIRERQKQITN